jgi:RimJ/RimL family protein N-acetyltransferase
MKNKAIKWLNAQITDEMSKGDYEIVKYLKGLVNAEKKAEIERLTEERERVAWSKQEYLDWAHGLLSTHTEMKDRGEDYKMFDRDWLCDILWLKSSRSMPLYLTLNAKEPNSKKQVDELTKLKTVKTVDCNGLCITFFHKNEEVGKASICDYQGREDNFLHGVEVKEKYRGQGYGRMIVEYMTTHYPVDTLYVEKANNAAIRLYERFGFALTCDNFDKDGKTMAVMARGQELYKQAVKDTAREILHKVRSYTLDKEVGMRYLLKRLEKEYGVDDERQEQTSVVARQTNSQAGGGNPPVDAVKVVDCINCQYKDDCEHSAYMTACTDGKEWEDEPAPTAEVSSENR